MWRNNEQHVKFYETADSLWICRFSPLQILHTFSVHLPYSVNHIYSFFYKLQIHQLIDIQIYRLNLCDTPVLRRYSPRKITPEHHLGSIMSCHMVSDFSSFLLTFDLLYHYNKNSTFGVSPAILIVTIINFSIYRSQNNRHNHYVEEYKLNHCRL